MVEAHENEDVVSWEVLSGFRYFFENESSGLYRGMRRELCGSERGTGPANKRHRVTSLPTTVSAPTADMKEGAFVVRGGWESR